MTFYIVFFAFVIYVCVRLSCAQPTGNSFTPSQCYRWKAETLKVCLLLVWRVCDQALGRCRPWSVPKSGHVTITKIENLHTDTCRKIHWFQNAILFDLRWKITKLSRKTVSEQWRHQALVNAWTDARRQYILIVKICIGLKDTLHRNCWKNSKLRIEMSEIFRICY